MEWVHPVVPVQRRAQCMNICEWQQQFTRIGLFLFHFILFVYGLRFGSVATIRIDNDAIVVAIDLLICQCIINNGRLKWLCFNSAPFALRFRPHNPTRHNKSARFNIRFPVTKTFFSSGSSRKCWRHANCETSAHSLQAIDNRLQAPCNILICCLCIVQELCISSQRSAIVCMGWELRNRRPFRCGTYMLLKSKISARQRRVCYWHHSGEEQHRHFSFPTAATAAAEHPSTPNNKKSHVHSQFLYSIRRCTDRYLGKATGLFFNAFILYR